MSLSTDLSIAEFDRFRFVRNERGELAELAAARREEREFLVLDCRRYRLARLHIFEGAAENDSKTQSFYDQMAAIEASTVANLTPLLSYGQDDTELYYLTPFIDGEALGDYMRRLGGLPESHAIDLLLDIVELISAMRPRPSAIENFDLNQLFVSKETESDRLTLHFRDFSGWSHRPMPSPEMLVRKLNLALYSLLGGYNFRNPPSQLFVHEAQHASAEAREMLWATLAPDSSDPRIGSLNDFVLALRELRKTAPQAKAAEPGRFLERWMTEGRGISTIDPGPDFRRPFLENFRGFRERNYQLDAIPNHPSPQGRVRFQVFLNRNSIPDEGWFHQHRTALKRQGRRGLPNQISTLTVQDHGRCLLIGEEIVKGPSLVELIASRSPLPPPEALEVLKRIQSAIDSIENKAGSTPVWWLPPRNVHLMTGKPSPASVNSLVETHGKAAWKMMPIRLRLHQTARDLVNGLDLPETILQRINSRGDRKGIPERRAAVLLPIFWYLVTGKILRWDQPLACPDALPLPAELGELLEWFRTRLVNEPESIGKSFVCELSRLVTDSANAENETPNSQNAETVDTGVSEPLTLFESVIRQPLTTASDPTFTSRVEAEIQKSGDFGSPLLAGRGHRLGQVVRRSTISLEDTEFIGSIEDPAYRLTPGEASLDKKETGQEKEGELHRRRLSLVPFSVHRDLPEPVTSDLPSQSDSGPQREPVLTRLTSLFPDPEKTGKRGNLLKHWFGKEPSEKENLSPKKDSVTIESAPEPDGSASEKNTLDSPVKKPESALPETQPKVSADLPSNPPPGWVSGLFSGTDPEPVSPQPEPEDNHSPSLSALPTNHTSPDPEAEKSSKPGSENISQPHTPDIDETNTIKISPTPEAPGEPMSFFSFLTSESIPAEHSEAGNVSIAAKDNAETASSPVKWNFGKRFSLHLTGFISRWAEKTIESVPDFRRNSLPGEAAPQDKQEPTGKKPSHLIGNGLKISALALSLWGLTYLLVSFAGTVERETLTETLPLLVETDYFKSANPFVTDASAPLPDKAGVTFETASGIARSVDKSEAPDPMIVAALADHYLKLDRPLGKKWLRRSAELGEPRHQRQLGLWLAMVPEDWPEAVSWLKAAAYQDDTEAQLFYGLALLRGFGTAQEPETGLSMIAKAADSGDGRALDLLGVALTTGSGRPADKAQIMSYFAEAVEAGNPPACYNLAIHYAKGINTDTDPERTAKLFRTGAERGNADCMHGLGRCYEVGFGVAKDLDSAILWMRQAASLGQQDALAWCLRQGIDLGIAKVD